MLSNIYFAMSGICLLIAAGFSACVYVHSGDATYIRRTCKIGVVITAVVLVAILALRALSAMV